MGSAPATSQIFIVTFPFLTFRKLKATVGTTSSLHCQNEDFKSNHKKIHEDYQRSSLKMNDHKVDRTCPEVITLTKEVFPDA